MKYSYKHTLHACFFGYITQAIVNNLAPLLFVVFQSQFKISFEMIGRLILINFGTQLIVDALAIKFVDKIGYRVSIILAHFFSALGLIALGILPNIISSPYIGLIIAVVIYAVGGGLIEVLVSPIVDALPGDAKASTMSLLHSFYCWGQVSVVLLSTIFIKIMGNNLWYILPILWSLVPSYNLIRFIRVPLMPAVAEHEKMPIKQLINSKLFLVALLLMLCAGASELAMSQWSSLFAEKGLQVPKLIGDLLGPCLFAVLMGIGRLMYSVWGYKLHIEKALLISAAFCIACYTITAFVQIPIISLLSCALCGLSVSLMWPGVFSLTAERYSNGGTAMFGMLAIFGDIGCAFGPWLAGIISDVAQKSNKLIEFGRTNGLSLEQVGLKAGLLIASIFPLIMFFLMLIYKSSSMKKVKI
ncbi:MAG: MFS transporter [Ruminiclostridium sp.]